MDRLKSFEKPRSVSFSYVDVVPSSENDVNEKLVVQLGKMAQMRRRQARSGSVPLIVVQKAFLEEFGSGNLKSDFIRSLEELPSTDLCSTEL